MILASVQPIFLRFQIYVLTASRWFLIILAAALVLSIVFCQIWPLDIPVWLTFLLIGINLIFAVPLSFLSATTGTNLGLGSLIQVITGFALPGNYNAYLYGQALGSWALAGYADNWVIDCKSKRSGGKKIL